ncbi:MAG: hypothetical protein ACAI43_24715 [Phycisphaerae bacterium]|nr:hypothetical protein [Tepidisphaeraceae bacterium]
MRPPVLILAALQIESRAIARELALRREGPLAWRASDNSVALLTIGLGASRLPRPFPPGSHVILAGVAGGLDPSLGTGTVILESDDPRLAATRGASAAPPEGERGERESAPTTGMADAVPMPRAVLARVHTAARIVATPLEKAALFASTGAAAVDMEADAVRAAAARVPFLSLRVILDDAHRALPAWLPSITDDLGRPRPLALAGRILRHPSSVRDLIRLARETKVALAALTGVLASLVSELAGERGPRT